MGFRIVKEHPAHFEAEGAKGTFRIAKSGLSPAAVGRYQSMCNGGVVKAAPAKPQKLAEGGPVDPIPSITGNPELDAALNRGEPIPSLPTAPGALETAGLHAAHGFTAHMLPVLTGAWQGRAPWLPERTDLLPHEKVPTYAEARDAMRGRLEDTAIANPATAFAADMAGGALASVAVPVGQVARGASAAQAIGAATKAGAGYGALYGAGDALSEGAGALETLGGAGVGAGVGAGLGAAFTAVLPLLGRGLGVVAEKVLENPTVYRALSSGDTVAVHDAFLAQALAAGVDKGEAEANARIFATTLKRFAKEGGEGKSALDVYRENPLQISAQLEEQVEGVWRPVDPSRSVRDTAGESGGAVNPVGEGLRAEVRTVAAPSPARLHTIAVETRAPVREDGTINAGEQLHLGQTRDWRAWYDRFASNPRVQKTYTQAELADLRNGLETTAQLFGDFSLLPAEGAGSPLRKNSDRLFRKTFDITTICPRQDLYLGTVLNVERSMGRLMNPYERHLVGVMLREEGLKPACWYCYGQAGRNAYDFSVAKALTIARDFVAEREGGRSGKKLNSVFTGSLGEDGTVGGKWDYDWKPDSQWRDFLDSSWKKIAKLDLEDEVRWRDLARGYVQPTAAEADLVKALSKQAQGATHANQPKGWASLKDHILRMDDAELAGFNATAGLRMNSQTDFRPWHTLELAEAFAQLRAKGGMAHVYTKEADFVRIFGGTGVKFNLSASYATDASGRVLRDARGLPVFDDVRGMAGPDIEHFRKKYPRDAGGMLVALNDEQLVAGLQDPRIDMMIPYHAGSVPGRIDRFEGARDFSHWQHEDWGKHWGTSKDPLTRTIKLANGDKVTLEGHAPITREQHHNSQARYFEICEKAGITPKFANMPTADGKQLLPVLVWNGRAREAQTSAGYMKLIRDVAREPGDQEIVDPRRIDWKEANRVINEWTAKGGDGALDLQGDPRVTAQVLERIHKGEWPKGTVSAEGAPVQIGKSLYAKGTAHEGAVADIEGAPVHLRLNQSADPRSFWGRIRDGAQARLEAFEAEHPNTYSSFPEWKNAKRDLVRAEDALKSGTLRMNQGPGEYGARHRPPRPTSGAPFHDLTGGGQVYPADVYTHGERYYGTGNPRMDREVFALARRLRGKPDTEVTIYRAVPADVEGAAINAGDWVTPVRAYAEQHGEAVGSFEDRGYRVIEKKVRASEVFTNGDSILEAGYWPADAKGPMRLEQPAWHGSPASFKRFELQKIGSGEGAQVYGHGMYFAEARPVAEGYRERLATTDLLIGGKKVATGGASLPKAAQQDPVKVAYANVATVARAHRTLDVAEAIAATKKDLEATLSLFRAGHYKVTPAAIDNLEKQLVALDALAKAPDVRIRRGGALYKVDVPENIELLDYDAPISEQSALVKARLEKAGWLRRDETGVELVPAHIGRDGKPVWVRAEIVKGKRFYDNLADFSQGPNPPAGIPRSGGYKDYEGARRAASEALNTAGIPGLRYFDQLSRAPAPRFPDGLTAARDAMAKRLREAGHVEVADQVAAAKNTSQWNMEIAQGLAKKYGVDTTGIIEAPAQTRNFVIWDEDAIRMMEKLRQPKPSAASERGFLEFRLPGSAHEPVKLDLTLLDGADRSTLAHETFHALSVIMHQVAGRPGASQRLRGDYAELLQVMGYASPEERFKLDPEKVRAAEERAAELWEQYLASGKAPSPALASAFGRFKDWLSELQVGLEDTQARGAFDRMLAGKVAGERNAKADALAGAALAGGVTTALGRSDREGYAHGGTVKGKDTMSPKHKLLENTEEHFLVQHPDGSAFKIAKRGLRPEMHDRIVQRFALGGEVEEAALPLEMPPVISGVPELDNALASSSVAPGEPAPPLAYDPGLIGQNQTAVLGFGVAPPAPAMPQPALTPVSPALMPSHSPPVVPATFSLPAPSGPAPGAPAPARPPAAPADPTSGTMNAITAATRQGIQGLQAQAQATANEAKGLMEAHAAIEGQRQTLVTDWNGKWQQWQQRADAMRQEIVDSKIDARRMWTEASTSSKISAAIGMVLGGIGAGMTGQPNTAAQLINTAIDRDIEAQKANLGKKQGLLAHHLQQGHTMMAAHQLARADLQDSAAALLQKESLKYAGSKAAASAQVESAKLAQNAAVLRQQVAATGLDMGLKGLQMQQTQLQIGMQRLQMQILGGIMQQQGRSGGDGTFEIPHGASFFLAPEMRERLVSMPNGRYAMARDKAGADTVNKTLEAGAMLRDKLQAYGAILKKHGGGFTQVFAPEDYSRAQALRQSILTDINGLAGLARLTDTEMHSFQQRVPDITSWQWRGNPHEAKLGELGHEIDAKLLAQMNQYLEMPRQRMR